MSQPTLEPEEYEAIRDAIWDRPWQDPARMPALLTLAVSVLGEIAMGADDIADAERLATQGLRRMLKRVLIGEWEYEDTHD